MKIISYLCPKQLMKSKITDSHIKEGTSIEDLKKKYFPNEDVSVSTVKLDEDKKVVVIKEGNDIKGCKDNL